MKKIWHLSKHKNIYKFIGIFSCFSLNKCSDPEDEWGTSQTGGQTGLTAGQQTNSINPTPDSTSEENATITNNPTTNTASNYEGTETNFTSGMNFISLADFR